MAATASIALSFATARPAAPARREFNLLSVLSTALELARQVGDSGSVNAKTIARVRKQILAA